MRYKAMRNNHLIYFRVFRVFRRPIKETAYGEYEKYEIEYEI